MAKKTTEAVEEKPASKSADSCQAVVVTFEKDVWRVTGPEGVKEFASRKEATRTARETAEKNGSPLSVYRKDGSVRV